MMIIIMMMISNDNINEDHTKYKTHESALFLHRGAVTVFFSVVNKR